VKKYGWIPWLVAAISVVASIAFSVYDRAVTRGEVVGRVEQMDKRLADCVDRFDDFQTDMQWLREQFILLGVDYQRMKRGEARDGD